MTRFDRVAVFSIATAPCVMLAFASVWVALVVWGLSLLAVLR